MTAWMHVNGHACTHARIYVPWQGPWFADCDMADEADGIAGAATLTIGDAQFQGTIRAPNDGSFALQRLTRIVAGADGWSSLVTSRSYSNDAGVTASLLASDVAADVGESIAEFAVGSTEVRLYAVRSAGVASRALEDAAQGAIWWVDYAGQTHVGDHPTAAASGFDVIEYDPRSRMVELAVDDVASVLVGMTLEDPRLPETLTIRSIEIRVSPDTIRIFAHCPAEAVTSPIADALRGIIERATDAKLWGKWRYRVFQMSGDRVDLQAVKPTAGLPDILRVGMWPGVAGVHAKLTPGAEVLVEFVEGDPAQPIVTHFAGKDGIGFLPVEISLAGGTSPVIRAGDYFQFFFPPTMAVSGTVSGNPFVGTITITSPGVGIMQGPGNTRVKA